MSLLPGPLRASLELGELRSLTGPPGGCITPEGSRGLSDTTGPGLAYPPHPPVDGPAYFSKRGPYGQCRPMTYVVKVN